MGSNKENGYAWRESNPNLFRLALEPSETKPGRVSKMTMEEFYNRLAANRRELDAGERHPMDKKWRATR